MKSLGNNERVIIDRCHDLYVLEQVFISHETLPKYSTKY